MFTIAFLLRIKYNLLMDKKILDQLTKNVLSPSNIPIISEEGLKVYTKQQEAQKRADHAMEVMVLAREVFSKFPTMDAQDILQKSDVFVTEGQNFFLNYVKSDESEVN